MTRMPTPATQPPTIPHRRPIGTTQKMVRDGNDDDDNNKRGAHDDADMDTAGNDASSHSSPKSCAPSEAQAEPSSDDDDDEDEDNIEREVDKDCPEDEAEGGRETVDVGNVEEENTNDLGGGEGAMEEMDKNHPKRMDIDPVDKVGNVDDVKKEMGIRYKWEDNGPGNPNKILLLLPTASQVADTPLLLACARKLGVTTSMGVFKIQVPAELQPQLPPRANKYHPGRKFHVNNLGEDIHRVFTQDITRAKFEMPALEELGRGRKSIAQGIEAMKRCLEKGGDLGVCYRTDIPAASTHERESSGLPAESPIWPLKGDGLRETIVQDIGGIHTPDMYEAAQPKCDGQVGALFGWHVEDNGLLAVNYLYEI